MSIQSFLETNIAILKAPFEVAEDDYDESILPKNVVASACQRSKYFSSHFYFLGDSVELLPFPLPFPLPITLVIPLSKKEKNKPIKIFIIKLACIIKNK